VRKTRKRYSSKIILPKWVLFPQKKKRCGENKKEGSSGEDKVNYYTNKKEELPMNAIIPYYNLNAKQKKSIISFNQKLYKKAQGKRRHSYSTTCKMLQDTQENTSYTF